jgi:hypothetical protein
VQNPFRKPDVTTIELKEAENIVKANLQELRRIANDLLLDNRYRKFSETVRNAERNTLDLLFRYKESDPYKYKSKVDEFLIELRVYKTILNSVKDLSISKPVSNPDFTQQYKQEMAQVIEKL